MKEKIITFFDSKWFNTIASILSIYILADIILEIRATDQFTIWQIIRLIIWLALAFHFIRLSYKAWK
jgi:hypothetical protein